MVIKSLLNFQKKKITIMILKMILMIVSALKIRNRAHAIITGTNFLKKFYSLMTDMIRQDVTL